MRLPTLALPLSMFAAALYACGEGTSTGNPNDNPEPGLGGEAGSGCKETQSEEVALDADTELGFRAGDVLSFIEGVHEETLTWNAQSVASYGPESGQQALTLEVTRKGAPRLTRYTHDSSRGEEVGSDCSPAIEVDVELRVKTAQGALDEQLTGTLQIKSALSASLYVNPKPDKLGGSFHITEVHSPGFKLVQLFLRIEFTKFGTSGELRPTFERRDSGSVGASAGDMKPLAAWGPPACGYGLNAVPRSENVAGFSADEVIALLDAAQGASVAFAGGAPSPLTLAGFQANDAKFACALLQRSVFDSLSPLGSVTIRGKLGVKSADGRIDGSWPLELVAKPNAEGALDTVNIQFDSMLQPSGPPSLDSWGIHGVDVSAYDFASPSLTLALSADSALEGELKVTGYKLPMCSNEVTETPGGGSGSPGCPGATPTDVTSARIRTSP
ncbi:MAG TPA: hypothetical protein VFZ61_17900 [Polyangiales bacterium]